MNAKQLHQDINIPEFDHLFKIEGTHEKENDIGKKCRFASPTCPHQELEFVIGSLQKDWKGEICYRVYTTEWNDTFGTVAHFDEVVLM